MIIKTNKKKAIIIIAFLCIMILSCVIALVLKQDQNSKEDNEKKEPTITEKNEEQKEEHSEENEDFITPEEPPIDNSNEENNAQPDQEKTEENQNNNSNNTGNNNNNSNNSSNNTGNSNNNSSNTNNNNNSNNENTNTDNENTTQPEESTSPVEVTSTNINLNNYDSDIIIKKDGTYTLSGTLKYTVYVKGDSKITLNLNGATIKSKTDSAIANIDTNELIINLNKGTNNTLSDGIVESEHDGCIFSYGKITIEGTGNLTVYGNQVDGEGIATKNSKIAINNGNIKIYSVDDGINTGGIGGTISINGGNLFVEAGGDAIDSNQDIVINNGVITLIGGSSGMNSSIDADNGYEINGGTIVALGSEQLEKPTNATQNTLLFQLNEAIPSKTLVTLLDSEDNVITSFKVNDKFRTIIISSDKLVNGKYYLYTGGTNSGTISNGLYTGGTYTKGELVSIDDINEFIIENKITSYKESGK